MLNTSYRNIWTLDGLSFKDVNLIEKANGQGVETNSCLKMSSLGRIFPRVSP